MHVLHNRTPSHEEKNRTPGPAPARDTTNRDRKALGGAQPTHEPEERQREGGPTPAQILLPRTGPQAKRTPLPDRVDALRQLAVGGGAIAKWRLGTNKEGGGRRRAAEGQAEGRQGEREQEEGSEEGGRKGRQRGSAGESNEEEDRREKRRTARAESSERQANRSREHRHSKAEQQQE